MIEAFGPHARAKIGGASDSLKERKRKIEPLLDNEEVLKELVHTLGIPRANIEALLKKQLADQDNSDQGKHRPVPA